MKLGFKHTILASYTGYITQAIVNSLAPLLFIIFRDSLGIPLSKITLLITFNFFIQLFVDYVSAKFIDKIGYRRAIVAAHILSAAGLISMAVLPFIFTNAFAGLLVSVILYAIGGGIIEVLISPIVEACPTENKASAMSLLHSFYCWGCVGVVLFSTAFLHFAGKESWRVLPIVWSAVPILNAVFFMFVPINTLTEESEVMSTGQLFRNGAFWLFFILMVTAGASEQGMSQWASAFAESGLGVSKTVGDLAGPCMFSVLMGTARVISARLSKRISLRPLMLSSGALCIIAYLIAALSPNSVLSLVGCGLCGFSVGVMWPGAFSMASAHFKNGGTAMFALLALAGDLGCMGGPTLVGEVASALSDNLKAGLLFAIIFPVLLVIICFILPKKQNN